MSSLNIIQNTGSKELYEINKLSKSHKRPNRPYGGYLCSKCARKHFKNEARQ